MESRQQWAAKNRNKNRQKQKGGDDAEAEEEESAAAREVSCPVAPVTPVKRAATALAIVPASLGWALLDLLRSFFFFFLSSPSFGFAGAAGFLGSAFGFGF